MRVPSEKLPLYPMSVIIRVATAEDVPAALALVRELAEYERALPEVETTEEEMRRDGFGTDPAFGMLVAELETQVVGVAIYYYKYSTWKGRCLFLEDIVITQAFRRKGIGSQLFNAVKAIARKEKVRRMEWQVLEWNEPAIRFYQTYDAQLDPEWINGKLVYEQLQLQ